MLKGKKLAASLLITAAFAVYACTSDDSKTTAVDKDKQQSSSSDTDPVARGGYLLTAGGCNDCHTPKVFGPNGMGFDSSRMFAGHTAGTPLPPVDTSALRPGQWVLMAPDVTAFVGPWGISYAANLTPDSATGIGSWTEEVFIKTLRTGKHLGMDNGRPILPPMPWFNLAALKDEDLKAIYAHLRSVKPINNRVPSPKAPNEVAAK